MKSKKIKGMLVLGVTVLALQAVCMPVGMVYAETTASEEEAPKQAALPTAPNLLEASEEKDPRFFFQRSQMTGTVNEPINVTISSDQEVSEVRVKLPEAAQVLNEQLPIGVSMEQDQHTKEWLIQAQRAQNTFVLPLLFESEGNYELSVEDVKATVEIQEQTINDNVNPLQDLEQSEASLENNESIEEDHVKDDSLEEANTSEEIPSTKSSVNVSTWAQYAAAINNRSVTVINVTANISGNTTLNNITRNLTINGNGFTINSQNQSYTLAAANLELAVRNATIVSTRRLDSAVFTTNSSAALATFRFSDLTFNSLNRFVGTSNGSHGSVITTILDGGNFDFSIPSTSENFNAVLGGVRRIIITNDAKVISRGRRLSTALSAQTDAQAQDMTFQIEEGSSLITDASLDATTYNILGTIEGARLQGHRNAIPIIINLRETGSLYLSNSNNNFDLFAGSSNVTLNISKYSTFDFSQLSGRRLIENRNINVYFDSESLALWDLGLQEEEKASMVFSDIEATLSGVNASIIGTTTNDRFQTLYDSSGLAAYSRMSNRPVEEMTRSVIAKYLDTNGSEIADTEVITGLLGENYLTKSKQISGYQLIERPSNESGQFSREMIEVSYIYEEAHVAPVDPLDPEVEVDPENKPELPEEQGRLSIDFVSQFNFGTQSISATDQTYFAQPQRLLNQDGTVNETEERPNYIQVSDRRSDTERHGWQLAVTQNTQFENEANHQLTGAQLRLTNQQLATAQDGSAPELQQTNPLALIPGVKRVLLMAQGEEGQGTWIYRFGDLDTASESVALTVPKGATPEATAYKATLTWELSAVPGN
ncbi:WxL domain-containing protein [Enterococcus mundtii]|uniref:WxL domain-containing protein n=1 Tax=Enterococcus TaxID=1350 RepID=UPI000452DF1A|nr:WxL domain-containing protein [Enterococcus mundtii]EYT94395.1 hypothetical protein AK89_13925 [Enterococcus mundtii CRL35]MDK4210913.1 WxL domain-containing protein [Enterococcus mundtii]